MALKTIRATQVVLGAPPPGPSEDAWAEFAAAHPDGTYWHSPSWWRYSRVYAPAATDYLLRLLDGDGRLVGLAPLLLENDAFTVGGWPGPIPLAAPGYGGDLIATVQAACRRARVSGVAFRHLTPTILDGGERGFIQMHEVWRTRVCYEAEWSRVRDSYKALIHRAQRRYAFAPLPLPGGMRDYAACHKATVGQVAPRADATYIEQGTALTVGQAQLWGAMDTDTGRIEAFAYLYQVRPGWWYYGSGCAYTYDGATHGLQWAIVEALTAAGHIYEIGWQGQASPTDEKSQGIEFYKRGFGGVDVPVYVTTVLA